MSVLVAWARAAQEAREADTCCSLVGLRPKTQKSYQHSNVPAAASGSCVGMSTEGTPSLRTCAHCRTLCSTGLLEQVIASASAAGVPLSGENALQRYDHFAFDRIAERCDCWSSTDSSV